MINIERINEDEYAVYLRNRELGKIEVYSNRFHRDNCYIKLNLVDYSSAHAKAVFDALINQVKKPLQAMVFSSQAEVISYLEAGDFVCKRRCYETEVSMENYVFNGYQKISLRHCEEHSEEYEECCRLMFEHYSLTHMHISPITVEYEEFVKVLPRKVIYYRKEDTIVGAAFVEENEIAYVCFKEGNLFEQITAPMLTSVVLYMFEKYDKICFEYDDCDWAAMKLASLFSVTGTESYNTYIKDYCCGYKLSKVEESYYNNPDESADKYVLQL